MNHADRHDPFAGLGSDTEGYKAFDQHYESVGRVDDLFVHDSDRRLYVGSETGLLGTISTGTRVEIVRVDDRRKVVEVAGSED